MTDTLVDDNTSLNGW